MQPMEWAKIFANHISGEGVTIHNTEVTPTTQ